MTPLSVGVWMWLCGFFLLAIEEDFDLRISRHVCFLAGIFSCLGFIFIVAGLVDIVAGLVELLWRSTV